MLNQLTIVQDSKAQRCTYRCPQIYWHISNKWT